MGRVRDILTAGTILLGAVLVIWIFMIRPYTFDWQPAGQTQATVKTLMSNSNVIGAAYINAVVVLEDERQVIVRVPLDADIRAGRTVSLSVEADAGNDARRRYAFRSVVAQE